MPTFPPPHVMLHPEDANSKVFLAIGRSFLSVDNRAMTIKDLAEMTMHYGLVCQNVSAAGQAITTYIRNHMQRCEDQEDHPLLLRHNLSGTSADDKLLPALHSRSGGAHCTVNPEDRLTNFRRGTMVWYLSRATGAPCPFARAGIQLCQYGENGKDGLPNAREKRERQRRPEKCGQKRKRLLRGHKGSDCESSEEGGKPPKVKLTLRLRPCATTSRSSPADSQSSGSANLIDLSKNSDVDEYQDDSMSVDSSSDEDGPEKADVPWSLPPYPKRSISIPCYTPFVEMFPSFSTVSPSLSAPSPINGFRRSPSVPYSVASPPPDSEDECEDYRSNIRRSRRFSTNMVRTLAREGDLEWDFDSEEDHGETETQWESPGPRSPSAPLATFGQDIFVKQESRDVEGVQGMLDHWEPLDSNIDGNRVIEVVAKAAAGLTDESSSMGKVKVEELECWDWEETYGSGSPGWYHQSDKAGESPHIKQEDVESDDALVLGDDLVMSPARKDEYVPCSPVSPLSGSPLQSSPLFNVDAPGIPAFRRHSELIWKDVELLGPDSVHPHDFEDGEWQQGNVSTTIRARAKTQPSLPTFEASCNSSFLPTQHSESSTENTSEPHNGAMEPNTSTIQALSSATTIQTQNSPPPPNVPIVSFTSPTILPRDVEVPEVVVVHTCQPCTPVISATQVEGISVYQMILGPLPLFRRIDTDFVNLSPIIAHFGLASPLALNSVLVSQGSAIVCGTWVPLASAQAFVREHPLASSLLETFLSDALFERFPSALQDFHRSNASGRSLNQFGPHFRSTLAAKRRCRSTVQTEMEYIGAGEPWNTDLVSDWDAEDHLSSHPPFFLALANLRRPPEEEVVPETPLSPTEQEMFYTLCSAPDWDKESSLPLQTMYHTEVHADEDAEDDLGPTRTRDQPRRRSKRVANANAIATRTRTRSQKRGARNSLS